MSPDSGSAAGRLKELRRAFDETFAALPRSGTEVLESLLLIRVAGEPFAIRARQVAGLAEYPRVAPVPSRIRELLGIAGIRGALVPVFDLAALLGFARTEPRPRWLAFASAETAVGLAFDQIEGQVEVAETGLYADRGSMTGGPIRGAARIGTDVRPIADIPAVVETIRRLAGLTGSAEE